MRYLERVRLQLFLNLFLTSQAILPFLSERTDARHTDRKCVCS
jgi:hypothetical protein